MINARNHTPEENRAYSEFIDSFFDEVNIVESSNYLQVCQCNICQTNIFETCDGFEWPVALSQTVTTNTTDMTDNKSIIQSEINQYINTIVLSFGDFNLYRLMGFYEDVDDYYYNMLNIKGKHFPHSCVMGFIPLKGKIDNDDYDRIENVFELNQPNRDINNV